MFEYQAYVKRVIDGDTIEVAVDLGFKITMETPVRLYGINAPESNSSVPEERKKARAAKDFLEDRILSKVVRIQSVKPKDKYGRWLATIFVIGRELEQESINDQLVKIGLAKHWDGQGEKPV